MKPIKRTPSLEDQTSEELMEWIKTTGYESHEQLPSEAEFAKEFNVSRSTIRAALSSLAAQGIIIRKQGSGTYMNHAMLTLRLKINEQWEFLEMIRSRGFDPGISFLDSEVIIPESEVTDALCLDKEEKVLKIRKIFTANNKPAIFSVNYLSISLVNPPYNLTKIKGPIFTYLEEEYGITPDYSITDLYAISADNELSKLLKIPRNTPLQFFKDVFFNTKNQCIMYAHNYFTDQLHFVAIRRSNSNWI